MFEEQPGNINDVTSPGTTAAAPFSRPIIVTDQPTQVDPMMAGDPADLPSSPNISTYPASDPAPSEPTEPATFAEQAATEAANTPDHFHSLQHDEAFAHDIKHRRFSIFGVLATLFLMAAAAFLGYYVTKVYLLK